MSPATDAFKGAPAHFQVALGYLGTRELLGDGLTLNPEVKAFFKATTFPEKLINAKTPWCAAFACTCLERAGIVSPRRASAISFLSFGSPAQREHLQVGDVLVFGRSDPHNMSAAHVGFYAGGAGDRIMVLGGNQANSVLIKLYDADGLLGYRRPPAPSIAK